ncbi:VanW family protein [Kytococcus sp. Marseille-QA3725]
MSGTARRGEGWQGVAATLILLLGILAVAYLVLVVVVGRTTPQRLSVAGHDLGNLSRSEAERTLGQHADRRMAEPVVVVVDGRSVELPPAELGLGLDVEESLAGTTGRTWDPRALWERSSREVQRDWAVTVDRDRLHARLEELAQETDRPATSARVRLDGTDVELTEGSTGKAMEVRPTARQVAREWPGDGRVEATTEQVRPEVGIDDLRPFTERVLRPALAGPITLVAAPDREPGGGSSPSASGGGESSGAASPSAGEESPARREVRLTAQEVAAMLSVGGDRGRPRLEVDASRWREDLPQGHALADRSPREPRLRLEGDGAAVTPGEDGQQVSIGDVERAVRDAVRAQDRRAEVPVHVTAPEADGETWPTTRLARFTTELPDGEDNAARTHNIRTLAREVNGTVVEPGEQFSLLEVMGEPTEEAGYREAHVISGGTLSNALGGGLSQVSTAVYNVAFLAGVQLDEHKPHSYYIARYPEGREATLWYPAIDNVWTNDTPTPMIVRATLSDHELTLSLYGTKQYDVTSETSPRREEVEHRRYRSGGEDCVSQGGVDGFEVTVERRLRPVEGFDGEGRTQRITTHYDPSDEVFCTNPDSPEYSGATTPPSDDYRPLSEREEDQRQDERSSEESAPGGDGAPTATR